MKKYLTFVFFTFILFGCSQEKDIQIQNIENNLKVSEQAKLSIGGKVPTDNPIFLALTNREDSSLATLDQLYKKETSECENLKFDYCKNLKHYGFKLLMENDLAAEGSDEQKEFYLQEQIKMSRNFPNIEHFYSLLLSCQNFKSKSELLSISKDFFVKNKAAIEIAKFSNPTEKEEKMTVLLHQNRLFENYMNTK